MPYKIKKRGGQYVLVNRETGKTKSHHSNIHKARAAVGHIARSEGRSFSALIKPKAK